MLMAIESDKDLVKIVASKTGAGKTRAMINDICFLGIGKQYHWKRKEWVEYNIPSSVCFVSREVDENEFYTMLICNLSGVDELTLLKGELTSAQKIVVNGAITLLSNSNITFSKEVEVDNLLGLALDNETIFIDYLLSFYQTKEVFRFAKIARCVFVLTQQCSSEKELANPAEGVTVLRREPSDIITIHTKDSFCVRDMDFSTCRISK